MKSLVFVSAFLVVMGSMAQATVTQLPVDGSATITSPKDPSAPPTEPPPIPGSKYQVSRETVLTPAPDDFLHYNKDKWNLRFYPFDLILSGMRVDFLTHGDGTWAIGPTIEKLSWSLGFVNSSSWAVGVTSTYGFGRPAFSHGWYLSPELLYHSGNIGATDFSGDSASIDYSEYSFALTGGYHWYWKSFNLALGLGGQWETISVSNAKSTSVSLNGQTTTTSGSGGSVTASGMGLTADFIMGVTF